MFVILCPTYLFFLVLADFTRDLPSYLQYCDEVVFCGAGSSHMNHREDELIEKLWDFYQSEKVISNLKVSYDLFLGTC